MKKLLKKDFRYRNNFKKEEHYKLILKIIYKNTFVLNEIRWKALYLNSVNNKTSSISLVKNCCIYTGRSSSINKKFKFSRLVLLKLSRFGLIHSMKKLSW